MSKFAINLLPAEFRAEEIKRETFVKVQTIGVSVILLMIFLSSLTIALRILQNQNINQIQNRLKQSENKVLDLKNTQVSLILLKDRLTAIDQYLSTPSKQTLMYQLINKLVPATVSMTSISVAATGEVAVSAVVPDSDTLQLMLQNLLSQEQNKDLISAVSLDSLNRGRDGIYRLGFKVTPK